MHLFFMFSVEYPMQLLPNHHSTPIERSSGTVFRQVHIPFPFHLSFTISSFSYFSFCESYIFLLLQESSQPLNLTSKPKSPQSLDLPSSHLQSTYRARDLQHSSPRPALSLGMWWYAHSLSAYTDVPQGLADPPIGEPLVHSVYITECYSALFGNVRQWYECIRYTHLCEVTTTAPRLGGYFWSPIFDPFPWIQGSQTQIL